MDGIKKTKDAATSISVTTTKRYSNWRYPSESCSSVNILELVVYHDSNKKLLWSILTGNQIRAHRASFYKEIWIFNSTKIVKILRTWWNLPFRLLEILVRCIKNISSFW